MKRFFLFACATMLAATAIISCKKSNSSPTVAAQITGTWKITKVYVDTNNNKIMDAYELSTSSVYTNGILKFNSDNSFSSTLLGIPLTGTWQLMDNNTYIESLQQALTETPPRSI